MTRHYHVGSGMPGCLFDNMNVYATRKDADNGLRWERDSLIDCYQDEDNYRKAGSIRDGLIVITFGHYGTQHYAERFRCDDPACSLDEED